MAIGDFIQMGEYGQEVITGMAIDGQTIYMGGMFDASTSSYTGVSSWQSQASIETWAANTNEWRIGYSDPEPDEWRCPYCGTLNPGTSRKCGTQFTGCQASR